MAVAPFNHGTRVIEVDGDARPLEVANVSAIGAGVVAPDADAAVFPENEPVAFYTSDAAKVKALGTTGNAIDIVNAVIAQGIDAQMVFVRVAKGATDAATMANLVGSASAMTGVHALTYALGHTGVEPSILLSPGYSAGRIDNAKNPVADAIQQVGEKLRAMIVLDTGGPTTQESLAYRADFASRYVYLVDPFVRVASGSDIVVKPASAYAAGLIVKKDKTRGGPYWSPSNQETLGILGTARPITYFDGEIDHEANLLNQNDITTFIPAQIVQGLGGQFAPNGRILWGNRTTSDDPLWKFINVVRTRATIEKTIIRSFRWANDNNLSGQLVLSVLRSLQELLDELTAIGAILGGRAYWERDVNNNANLRDGKLRVEFDAEEAPPLEDLIFGSRRNEAYFDNLADNIQRQTTATFTTNLSDLIAH